MEQTRKAVVVTGFGPFGEHTVNASWIAVQELEKLGLGDSVDLHVYEIPVEYETVRRLIPALWEKHSPQLVVHVGVSGMATTVTLEKCGHNKGYKGLDNCRFCPGSQCCVEDGPESIDSVIDMDAVCKRVTTLGLDVSVTISQDAGTCVTSPTTHRCIAVVAAQPLSMCPRWANPTTPTSWAVRCGPSSRRCWMSWSSLKAKSATATNTDSFQDPITPETLPGETSHMGLDERPIDTPAVLLLSCKQVHGDLFLDVLRCLGRPGQVWIAIGIHAPVVPSQVTLPFEAQAVGEGLQCSLRGHGVCSKLKVGKRYTPNLCPQSLGSPSMVTSECGWLLFHVFSLLFLSLPFLPSLPSLFHSLFLFLWLLFCICFFVLRQSHYIAQAGCEFNPPALASQVLV